MKWFERYLVDPARMFAWTAVFFGMSLVFLVPPFQSPDEYNHFFRAFQVSEGRFFPEKIADNRLGGTLPSSLDSLKKQFLPLKGDYAAKIHPAALATTLNLRLRPSDRRFMDFPNTAIYAPTAYIAQAVGIALVRQFTDRVLVLFYASRLFNLLLWIGLIWAALRRMPFQRWTMAVLALLPASLAIAASANADVITNGLTFYLVAVFCREMAGVPVSMRAYLGILLVVSVNKLVFAPLALLVGLKAGRHWKKAIQHSVLPLALALTAAIAWGSLAGNWFIPYDRYDPAVRDEQTLNPSVDPSAQMMFMLEHPGRFITTAVTSVVRAMPSISTHWVGKFGWEKNYLPAWVLVLLWLTLVGVVFFEKNPLSAAQRGWVAGIILCSIVLWAITMYALWCPVGAMELDNWQGRYFTPLGPLLALTVGAGWRQRWLKYLLPVAWAGILIGNTMLVFAVIGRYYFY